MLSMKEVLARVSALLSGVNFAMIVDVESSSESIRVSSGVAVDFERALDPMSALMPLSRIMASASGGVSVVVTLSDLGGVEWPGPEFTMAPGGAIFPGRNRPWPGLFDVGAGLVPRLDFFKLRPGRLLSRPSDGVLIVGPGDFSFTLENEDFETLGARRGRGNISFEPLRCVSVSEKTTCDVYAIRSAP